MTLVEVVEAKDETLRETKVRKRWRVTPKCKKPFEGELQMLEMLKLYTIRWRPRAKTRWQKVNVIGTFFSWCKRLGAARQVMRLNHTIYERTRGFGWARRHAIKSAILFGCPRFMQGFLSRRFLLRARRKQAKEAADAPPTTVEPLRA